MTGLLLMILAVPLGVAALVYGDYGAAGAAGAGLGALVVTSLIGVLPLTLLVRAKRRALAQPPVDWIDRGR